MKITNIINRIPRRGSNPVRRSTLGVVVHHTGNIRDRGEIGGHDDEQRIRDITQWVINHKTYATTSQYHYIIGDAGEIFYCVDDKVRLWHCSNYQYNLKSISVAVLGHGDHATEDQMQALAGIIQHLKSKYGNNLEVKGHRDFTNTYCPSDKVYNYINILNQVKGAKTMAEPKYTNGDILEFRGNGRNVRANLSGDVTVVHTLQKGDRVTALGSAGTMVVPNTGSYPAIDINFGEGTGWTYSKDFRLVEKADKAVATNNAATVEEIRKLLNQIK